MVLVMALALVLLLVIMLVLTLVLVLVVGVVVFVGASVVWWWCSGERGDGRGDVVMVTVVVGRAWLWS